MTSLPVQAPTVDEWAAVVRLMAQRETYTQAAELLAALGCLEAAEATQALLPAL